MFSLFPWVVAATAVQFICALQRWPWKLLASWEKPVLRSFPYHCCSSLKVMWGGVAERVSSTRTGTSKITSERLSPTCPLQICWSAFMFVGWGLLQVPPAKGGSVDGDQRTVLLCGAPLGYGIHSPLDGPWNCVILIVKQSLPVAITAFFGREVHKVIICWVIKYVFGIFWFTPEQRRYVTERKEILGV